MLNTAELGRFNRVCNFGRRVRVKFKFLVRFSLVIYKHKSRTNFSVLESHKRAILVNRNRCWVSIPTFSGYDNALEFHRPSKLNIEQELFVSITLNKDADIFSLLKLYYIYMKLVHTSKGLKTFLPESVTLSFKHTKLFILMNLKRL